MRYILLNNFWILNILVICFFIVILVSPVEYTLLFCVIISLFVLFIVFTRNIELFVLCILVIRSSLDSTGALWAITVFEHRINISGLIALSFITIGIFYIIRSRISIFKYPLTVPFLVFLITCLVTLIPSWDKMFTFQKWIRLLNYYILYIVIANVVTTREQVKKVIGAILLSTVIPTSVGLYQVLTRSGRNMAGFGSVRISGTFAGVSLAHASFLIIPILIVVMLFLQANSLKRKIGYSAILTILSISFYYTFARTPWIGFLIAILTIGVLKYRYLLIATPVLVLILLLTIPGISYRFSGINLISLTEYSGPFKNTMATRVLLWHGAIAMFKSSPIIGNGLGIGAAKVADSILGRMQAAVHSDYFQMLVDAGILGLGAYLWLLFVLFKISFSAYRKATDPFFQNLFIGFIAVWTAFMLIRGMGNIAIHTVIQYYFWAYAGLVSALSRMQESNLISDSDVHG